MAVTVAAVTFVADRTFGWGGTRLLMESQIRFSRLYKGDLSADVLILGHSSDVDSLFVPALEERTGSRVRSLAWNGLSAEIAEALWLDWVDRHPAPRLLLLEASFVTGSNRLLGDLRPYYRVSERLSALARRDVPTSYWGCRVARLYCLNSEVTLRGVAYARKQDQSWVNRYRITPALIAGTRDLPPQVLDPATQSNLEALRRILTSADAAGTEVILLVGPYLPSFREKLSNTEEWRSDLEAALSRPIADYTASVRDSEFFSDRIHMNDVGARAFADVLVNDGVVPPP